MINEFQRLEDKGRMIFKVWCDNNPVCKINKFSTNDYTKWDVSYWHNDTPIVGEIKHRLYNHDSFDTWIIQLDKMIVLKELADKLNIKPYYINIYKDSTMLIWDLNTIDIKVSIEEYNKTFCGNNKLIKKEVIHLPTNKAIKIKLN